MFRPAVRQAQAAPKQAAKAAVAKLTRRPTTLVLRAPVLNMFARRAALHVPLQQVPAEATHRAEAITEATAPAVPTTETARLREAPLQLLAAAQAVATVVAAAALQARAAAIAAQAATALVAVVAVQAAVAEEDNFRAKTID